MKIHLLREQEPVAEPNHKQRARARALEALKVMNARWPEVFPAEVNKVVPLAIGIHFDLNPALADEFSPKEVSHALGLWVSTTAYLTAIAARRERRQLDGTPAGKPTEEHVQVARLRLHEIKVKRKEAKQAKQVKEEEPVVKRTRPVLSLRREAAETRRSER